jgi:hypothetical protein
MVHTATVLTFFGEVIMLTSLWFTLKGLAHRLMVVFAVVAMGLGLLSTPVLAASTTMTQPGEAPGITEPVPGENLSELQEQRRDWQKQASSSNEDLQSKPESLGETIKEKLNLEEITDKYQPEKKSEGAQENSY